MKYLLSFSALLLLLGTTHSAEVDEWGQLIWGQVPDRRGIPRISLMKAIVNPESCKDLRVQVQGYIWGINSRESVLFYLEEHLEEIDMGNAVFVRAEGLDDFLLESKARLRTSRVTIIGTIRYRPEVANIERQVLIEPECIVFSTEESDN